MKSVLQIPAQLISPASVHKMLFTRLGNVSTEACLLRVYQPF